MTGILRLSFFVTWLVLLHVNITNGNLNVSHSLTGWSVNVEGKWNTLKVRLGNGTHLNSIKCADGSKKVHCFQNYDESSYVTVNPVDVGISTASCVEIEWHNPDSKQVDCVNLGEDLWYGGSTMKVQRWPIQNVSLKRVPFITGDFGAQNLDGIPFLTSNYGAKKLGGIMEGMWISSNGSIIFVDRATPLFISFNQSGDEDMCLSASYHENPFSSVNPSQSASKVLKYTMCTTDNVREAYQVAYGRWLRKPMGPVDASVVAKPIWSTWARYKRNINQDTVIKFAKEIVSNGFGGSYLEIDDKWETCYGELDIDLNKFPNASDMVEQLKSMGFNVSMWIHPYTNIDCPSFMNPDVRKYLIKDKNGNPLPCVWFNGIGGYLDTTNPDARDYFFNKVKHIKTQTGVDTFKFDSGEVSFISENFVFSDTALMATPNEYTRHYVETAARFGSGVEVRVAYGSQHLPIFVRMLDKDSVWDYNNGLQSLIPTALHMSVIGYPYILPDMIGGNSYDTPPDRELFVRWLQATVFMPSVQFSIVPWDYDQEVVDISKSMVALHLQYSPLIKRLAQEASVTGDPIIRPLWWIAPKDQDALKAEQEFLLGEDLLVAPVVEKGATSRDIYLPDGTWEDQIISGRTYQGPIWLTNYQANLTQLPYFFRK